MDELPAGRFTMTTARWFGSELADDQGLTAHLSGLQEVVRLELTDCGHVTDAAVPVICRLPRLLYLLIDGTGITESGVMTLLEQTSVTNFGFDGRKQFTDRVAERLMQSENVDALSVKCSLRRCNG